MKYSLRDYLIRHICLYDTFIRYNMNMFISESGRYITMAEKNMRFHNQQQCRHAIA